MNDFTNIRYETVEEDRTLSALDLSPEEGGRIVQSWETRPQGDDAMEPDEVNVFEGSWAVVMGTNAKPAGWIDTHALLAGQTYRDRLVAAPSNPVISDEMVGALKRIRDASMLWTIKGQIPEAGVFGTIAQDADWLCDQFAALSVKPQSGENG